MPTDEDTSKAAQTGEAFDIPADNAPSQSGGETIDVPAESPRQSSADNDGMFDVPADSELVTCLLGAYHDNTGLPAVPEYTGGGTYAKVLKQGVAFGAYFPDDPDLAHQANEYVNLNKMILAAKIYADALMRLCAE